MAESPYGNRYNRARIVELYERGYTVSQIAKAAKCDRKTVYNHLDAAGVERRDDRKTLPGAPRKTHCKREHPFDEKNTRIDCNGERHCRKCEALRARRRRINKIIREAVESQQASTDNR